MQQALLQLILLILGIFAFVAVLSVPYWIVEWLGEVCRPLRRICKALTKERQ